MNNSKNESTVTEKTNEVTKEKCGIVMPISQLDSCTEQHWLDVKNILTEAIESANFEANLVSNADDVGIIQKRIIQNIYDNPIIVCDVSGKNPNVMFELGLRLAFDKPTIIVKDDQTSYSFDTSPIEHLTYPRDLRFNKIVEFKKELSEKIRGTYKKAKEDKNFSTFLKHFGKFTVAKLETTEVSKEQFIIEELRDIRHAINYLINERSYENAIDKDSSLSNIKCRDELQRIINRIIRTSKIDLNKTENRELLINKVLTRKDELPSCFNINGKSCMRRLNETIEKYYEYSRQ